MKAKKMIALLLALIMVAAFAACGDKAGTEDPKETETSDVTNAPENVTANPEADSEADKYGGTLVTCRSVNPSCLFWPYQYGATSKYTFPAIEQLGRYNYETGHYDPFLAESWERDNENLTLTIKLKEGIKFTDGSDFNADVVKWEFDLMEEFGNSSQICNPVETRVIDEYTVEVQYDSFSLDWEDMIGQVLIYSKKAYEDNGLDWCVTNMVGTGPFVLDEYVVDSYMSFSRNENYWQEGLPYLDGVRHQIIPEWSAEMSAFVNGEIDWFVCGDLSTIESLTAMGIENAGIQHPNSDTVFGVYPNSMIEGDPFYIKEVRQAVLLYGVDWDLVTFAAKGQYGVKTIQGVTKGALGYTEELEEKSYYDPDLAKQMLADAGYPDGFKTKIITANYGVPAATALQDQLKLIGIEAEVEQIATSDPRRYDGTTGGLYINSGNTKYDYTDSLVRQYSRNGQMGKMCAFSDEYEELVAQLQACKTYEEKDAVLDDALQMLHVDECWYRVMFNQPNILYLNERVMDSGLESNAYYTPEIAWIKK